jgi:hypothetical protein
MAAVRVSRCQVIEGVQLVNPFLEDADQALVSG